MCGIAGIIYRDGSEHAIGDEMTRMLQAMKHRGPDSTGYALYGSPANGDERRSRAAMPMSATFTTPSMSMSTLSGRRSRWTTPRRCAAPRLGASRRYAY